MSNNFVGKKVNTPKRKYLGKYFLLLALGFYVNPIAGWGWLWLCLLLSGWSWQLYTVEHTVLASWSPDVSGMSKNHKNVKLRRQ